MIKSQLSDEETEILLGLVTSGRPVSVIKYVNRLLYDKGKGDDLCARPIAFRDKKDMNNPCFAIGYLNNVKSYMTEAHNRKPSEVIKKTGAYIEDLKMEIGRYFQ